MKKIFLFFSRILEKKLFTLSGNHYVFWIKLLILKSHLNISNLKYDKKKGLYRFSDSEDDTIYYTVPARINRFKFGIDKRLSVLANQYLIGDIIFNENDIIVDVGANIGEFSLHLCRKYNLTSICIEPEKNEFNCLLENLSNYKFKAFNLALWHEKTTMTLYQKNKTSDSSLLEIDNYTNKITVQTTTLDFLIEDIGDQSNIKLIKLEAEGVEPEILMGSEKTLTRTEYITVDIGPERGLKKDTTLIPVNNILIKNNFELIGYFHKRGIVLYKNSAL